MDWNWKNTDRRYGSPSITMHWMMLALLVAVYATIQLHDLAPRGSELRATLKTWHFTLGVSVLALAGVRIAVRALSGPAPGITPAVPRWQMHGAHIMHAALYGFLVAMPVLGWLTLSAAGKPIPFFGLRLPALTGVDDGLARTLKEAHEAIGTFGYYLIGLHAAAALLHHYLMRDDTLARMLPETRTKLRHSRPA